MLPGTSTSRSTTTASGSGRPTDGSTRSADRPRGLPGDGGLARLAAFGAPHGLDALADRTVIVADSHNGVIRRIDGATRIVATIARGFSAPVGVDATPDESICCRREARPRRPHRFRREPDAARRALQLPSSVVVDRAGRFVYVVSEFDGRRISRIDSTDGVGAGQALTTTPPTTLSCSAWFFLSQSGQR